MSDNGELRHTQIPAEIDDEARLENRLATGSDNSAGIPTRFLAGVLLAVAFPWVVTRRVVSNGAPPLASVLRKSGAAAARGARWFGASG